MSGRSSLTIFVILFRVKRMRRGISLYVQCNSSMKRKHYSLFSLVRSKRVDRDAAHDENERLSTNAGSVSADEIASSTFSTSLQIAASQECIVILTVYSRSRRFISFIYAKKTSIFFTLSNLKKRYVSF